MIGYFLNQRLFINILTVILMVLGYYSVTNINRERYPVMDMDIVIVQAIYPGASPRDMEELVTTPIEDALRQSDGIDELESTSQDGRSSIFVYLDPDYPDKSELVQEIQQLVASIDDFPADMDPPLVQEISSRRRPVGSVIISLSEKRNAPDDDETADQKKKTQPKSAPASTADSVTAYIDVDRYRLLSEAARTVEDELLQIDEVAGIEFSGLLNREFRVEVLPERLKAYSLDLNQVVRAIQDRNAVVPVGRLYEEGREVLLQSQNRIRQISDLDQVVVRANEDGNGIMLPAIARLKDTFEQELTIQKVNPDPATMNRAVRGITLTILKKIQYDTIETVALVEKQLSDTFNRLNKDPQWQYDYKIIDNASVRIQRRLNTLYSNSIIGIIMVVLMLLLFLNWRISLVTAVGIPLAFSICFTMMKLFGYNLDLATMLGLIIVVGMLVDDAIIVAENIYRYLQRGDDPDTAAYKGTKQVALPVLATIMTTIAAFSPLLLMSGFRGKYAFFIAIVVILALVASYLECMVALPAHVADFVKPASKSPPRLRRNLDALFVRLKRFYGRQLAMALHHRYKVSLLALAAFIGVMFILLTGTLPFVPFPRDDMTSFMLVCETEKGTALNQTALKMNHVEDVVMALPVARDPLHPASEDILISYQMTVGVWQHRPTSPYSLYSSHYAVLKADITGDATRSVDSKTLMANLRKSLKEVKEKQGIDCGIRRGFMGGAVKDGIEVRIQGRDPEKLQQIKKQFYDTYFGPDSTYAISDDAVEKMDVLAFKLKPLMLGMLGISSDQVNTAVRTAFEGLTAASLRKGGDEVYIKVVYPTRYRTSPYYVGSLPLLNKKGNTVNLAQLAEFNRVKTEAVRFHKNFRQTLTILLESKSEDQDPAVIVNKIRSEFIPRMNSEFPGYKLEFGGSFKEREETRDDLLGSFNIALLFIFLILVTLFQSFAGPLIVMMAIPLGFIGAVAALLVHNDPLSFMAGVGFIGLIGVLVNDSLVLVSFIRESLESHDLDKRSWQFALRDHRYTRLGLGRAHVAMILASKIRLRAVLLTTFTTFFGLLPTAYGIGGEDSFIEPLALVFAWGLFFATVNTLVVIPVFYAVYMDAVGRLEQLNEKIRARFHRT